MTLSIITINRNNAAGLEKTMQSVLSQTCSDFEYVVVDGASTDWSMEVIRKFESELGDRLKWISEPDKGIYNAMNKGIGMATGDYLEFLNSGDRLATTDCVAKMFETLFENNYPSILYGNMLKEMLNGRTLRDNSFAGKDITFLDFYNGTLNHSSAYIKKDLFKKYGLYDESLKIVSDWKWFLQVIVLGNEKPFYTNTDISLYDMSGISETNKALGQQERNSVLSQLIPSAILSDYEKWSSPIRKMNRIMRCPFAYRMVCILERILFKWEKSKLDYVK